MNIDEDNVHGTVSSWLLLQRKGRASTESLCKQWNREC